MSKINEVEKLINDYEVGKLINEYELRKLINDCEVKVGNGEIIISNHNPIIMLWIIGGMICSTFLFFVYNMFPVVFCVGILIFLAFCIYMHLIIQKTTFTEKEVIIRYPFLSFFPIPMTKRFFYKDIYLCYERELFKNSENGVFNVSVYSQDKQPEKSQYIIDVDKSNDAVNIIEFFSKEYNIELYENYKSPIKIVKN